MSNGPNFIIAGGVACGTSFLSSTLLNHPDIYLPKVQRPEPNFFHYSWKYQRGIPWYISSWFADVDKQRAIGERSSLLLTSPLAASRIAEAFPHMKIIFCLRNPVERAWGNYRFTVLEGLEPLPFEEALEQEQERIRTAQGAWAEIQPHAYVTRSRYVAGLQSFFKSFSKEQILILKSEEMARDPHGIFRRVCDFLGIDCSIPLPATPNYSSPDVLDRSLQMELRRYFGDRFSLLIEEIREERALSLDNFQPLDLPQIERLKANLAPGKSKMSESARQFLTTQLQDDLSMIKELTGCSTDGWF